MYDLLEYAHHKYYGNMMVKNNTVQIVFIVCRIRQEKVMYNLSVGMVELVLWLVLDIGELPYYVHVNYGIDFSQNIDGKANTKWWPINTTPLVQMHNANKNSNI